MAGCCVLREYFRTTIDNRTWYVVICIVYIMGWSCRITKWSLKFTWLEREISLSVLGQQDKPKYVPNRLRRCLFWAVFLVGPCALEYTKLKTADHYWTDPSADELVQRHRIHGVHGRQDSPSKRPALGVGIYCVAISEFRHRLIIKTIPRVRNLNLEQLSVMKPLSQIRSPFGPKCPLYLYVEKFEIQD